MVNAAGKKSFFSPFVEEHMNLSRKSLLPIWTKQAVWSAVIGSVVTMIVGFSWGGWVTNRSASDMARQQSTLAVVNALAPFCAEKFRNASDATEKFAELRKASSWSQSDIVSKTGAATFDGKSPDTAVAKACADLLLKPVA